MVQPRSAADRIVLAQIHDKHGMFLQENTRELPLAEGGATPQLGKKRRRDSAEAPKKRRRGEQGGRLCRLNLDELYIIFAYIYPMDLLNLARTCKSLRGLLMHRSSAFLWKTALRQVEGLPECPTDLSEPEYTNLVFCNRCHGCGKPAKTVLWNIRHRYCPACRVTRLCHTRCCDVFIRENNVLPSDRLTIGQESGQWVDRDQMNSFLHEYRWSSDKTRFLDERREQNQMIHSHARKCESWQQQKGRVHRFDLDVLRKERQTSIFERLRQLGYGPEINHFRPFLIKRCNQSVSKKYTPLTDSEWNRMWPEWAVIMNTFRPRRLETVVYPPRRRLLLSEYDKFVTNPSPDSPTFDLLPHVADLACFPPFRDAIETLEEPQMNDAPFAAAFAQLPELVNEWMQKLNSEIAGLVKIPCSLSSNNDVSGDRDKARSTRYAELSQTDLDKFQLACAVFRVGGAGAFVHPEALSVSMRNDVILPRHATNVIGVNHELQFLEEAPYIIHACGLDPSVATVHDMDHRNARLRCLSCGGRALIMNWRHAIWHAHFYHCISIGLTPLSESPRWQLVHDEYIDEIQAVERSVQKAFSPDWTRCLLCRPRVGDAMLYVHAVLHLAQCHHLPKDVIQEGVHYKLMGIRDVCVAEMVEVGGEVTFRVLEE
ncbi:hypothetical protein OG21DRAFT_1500574 [Imleria badia]|nr:hypothetical protein OG21DRAFT_1500574 [Imleria badia]